MKSHILTGTFCLMSLFAFTQFEGGEKVRVSESFSDDIYIAGGELFVDAPINGDAVLAGGKISLNDSVTADVIIGGGDIVVNGFVGDDVRIAGGTIELNADVMDDFIVFGGQIRVGPEAVIHGNLVSYGGEINLEGSVLGEAKISGGEIEINGTVEGQSAFSASEIEIGEDAEFLSDVRYWTEDGEVDFGSSTRSGQAIFDTALAYEGNDYGDMRTLLGTGIFFAMMFLLGGFLILILLEWAFGNLFSEAAKMVGKSLPNSLGIGVIYVIGAPILIFLSLMIVIGIPIGLFSLVIYLFSMLFGNFVAALILTNLWKERQDKSWNYMVRVFIALVISAVLQLLTAIPFLGFLISFLVLCITYGAIILVIRTRRSGPQEEAQLA